MQKMVREEMNKGAIRRIRRAITIRSQELESLKPVGKCEIMETEAYIRGLEFALRAIDINLPEL